MSFRPLLGYRIIDNAELVRCRFPLFFSVKLDGIRAGWEYKEFLSRTRKTIPNRFLRQLGEATGIPSGYDGELIVGEPNAPDVYRKTNSFCLSMNKLPTEPVRFFVFDNYEAHGDFSKRLETVIDLSPLVVKLDQILCDRPDDVLELETRALKDGYEGAVLRAPDGKYKQGRSTLREQYLLKLKRFVDAEAEVIGFEELLHNANEATIDERGYAKRSSHQENKIPMGTLGALICKMGEIEFRIGTGFSESDRAHIWANRDRYCGALAKFKSFPIGVKTAPRHPVWLGWRSRIDL